MLQKLIDLYEGVKLFGSYEDYKLYTSMRNRIDTMDRLMATGINIKLNRSIR